VFPGPFAHGHFQVDERGDLVHVRYRSDDGAVAVEVRARRADRPPDRSVFDTIDEASEFFRRDDIGYSPGLVAGDWDAMQFQPATWNAAPLAVECVHSSWFDDESRFPRGTIELDSALLMQGIEATWASADGPRTSNAVCAGRGSG
jgi:hypothetical protein